MTAGNAVNLTRRGCAISTSSWLSSRAIGVGVAVCIVSLLVSTVHTKKTKSLYTLSWSLWRKREGIAATFERTSSAKVKKCPVGVRRKAMVTRPIHCLRFVVLARIPQKHQATPQNPSQSSQYIAGIVRIARIARIPRQCNHSHSRATSYASGNTGTPRGYFCTFADAVASQLPLSLLYLVECTTRDTLTLYPGA